MSWMDSWSRPKKQSAAPPPFYTTQRNAKYCHSCGRIISSSAPSPSTSAPQVNEKKFCSSRCKSQKPGPQDRRIEDAFVQFLNTDLKSCHVFEGEEIPASLLAKRTKPVKGDSRMVVPCSVVEELIYGSRYDETKTSGRNRNRASRVIGGADGDGDGEGDEEMPEELEEFTPQGFAGKIRPPQHLNDVNGGIGGEKGRAEKKDESEGAAARRREGMRVTEEKERVKRAARRGAVFGFLVGDGDARRKCEVVSNGKVVEPSFAKGDWGVRWRE